MRLPALVLAAALVAAAPARADVQPGAPPPLCASSAFADVLGTPAGDVLASPGPAQRIYGLGGPDQLIGSRTRATCLFGGPGDDAINLNAGGGVAWGESGRDYVFGSPVGDVLAGGPANDAVVAEGGDDRISVRDRRAEIVACGEGDDTVTADRRDVLIACESAALAGRDLPHLEPRPRAVGISGRVRVRLAVRRAGDYRALYVSAPPGQYCASGPLNVAHAPGLRSAQRVAIELIPPGPGWCEGPGRVAILRDADQGRPAVPVARVAFRVR